MIFHLLIHKCFTLATINSIIYYLIVAFVTQRWMVFLASAVGFLNAVYTTVLRSMITKMVSSNEIGKVFSVVEFFKSIESFLCPLIYGKLYEKTVSSVPNAFIFLSISANVLVFMSLFALNLLKRGKLLGVQVSKRRVLRERSKKMTTNNDIEETKKTRGSFTERGHPILEKRFSNSAL